jgi:hypothetical protein
MKDKRWQAFPSINASNTAPDIDIHALAASICVHPCSSVVPNAFAFDLL